MAKTIELQLSVPTELRDITLGQYQKYMKILEKNKDNENATEFINLKAIEIFCDVEFSDVMDIPVVESEKIIEIINNAFQQKTPLVRRFELLGVDMGFVPNMERISLGEYIDIEDNIGDWDNMHKAMAALYRPVNFKSKERYTIAPYKPSDEVNEIMKEMPLDVVFGSMVFFYDLGMELLRAIPTYIQQQMTEEQTYLLKQTLAQNGVGINQFTDWLKEMSLNSMQLPNYQSSNV